MFDTDRIGETSSLVKEKKVVHNSHILVVTPEPQHGAESVLPRAVETDAPSLAGLMDFLQQQGFTITRLAAEAERAWLYEVDSPVEEERLTIFLYDITAGGVDLANASQRINDMAQFIRHLRSIPELRTLPVIAVGAEDSKTLWRRAIHAGALDYLPYSVQESELMHTFESASERQNAIFAEVQRQVEVRYQDIIGIIQHEFRTPMTLLLGYGEYLREALDGQIDRDELRLSVEAILSGSNRLNRLIESFLLLSDLQYRSASVVQMQNVAPEHLWREAQAVLRVEAEETGLEIVHSSPDNVPITAADPELLREALLRLLDNALRFVRPDSRRIHLGVAYDAGWIWWTIQDEGPGIEPTQIQRILEPFGRAQGHRYMPQSVGLSLAIAKRVAELHGGELSVESRLGQGSRFILRIPRVSPAAPSEDPANSST